MANTLAYYDTATITAIKSFIVQALGYVLVIFITLTFNTDVSGKISQSVCSLQTFSELTCTARLF